MYQLSCLISHIRCTKKVWKPAMTQLKYLFYFFVHLVDNIGILKLQFPLFLATLLTNKSVILFLQCQSYNNCAFHNSAGYSNISLFIKDRVNVIPYN